MEYFIISLCYFIIIEVMNSIISARKGYVYQIEIHNIEVSCIGISYIIGKNPFYYRTCLFSCSPGLIIYLCELH